RIRAMDNASPPKANSSLKTLEVRPDPGEMIKPAELIDVSGVDHLTLAARRLYNALIANAFGPEMARQGYEWIISLSDLRGTHKGNERLSDSILALMKTVVTVRLANGTTRRVQLLGGNDMHDEDRKRGVLTYSFDPRLVALLKNSSVFGKLEIAVMMAFSTKYALALYEALARRARLKYKFSEEFSLDEFRDLLGVAEDKLATFGNLNQYAIKPAVNEINALATFGVKVTPVKTGRKVTGVHVGWWQKDITELKASFAELQRHKSGRQARIEGKVEKITDYFLAK
ncbi:MAG: replication initiation protein, partial [Nitrospirota bacterium]|nr:replication initiation protein [Nitrospirota bacterium]